MGISWRYVVPNLLTCVSIVCGLLSISESIAGRFESAAWFILLCVLLDKADGAAARALKASSEFGVQMDSLCDLITFGVAPGVFAISLLAGPTAPEWTTSIIGYRVLVYVGSFVFVVLSVLRLAKFNVLTETYGKDYFFGVPTTAAGGVFACYSLTIAKYEAAWQFTAALPAVMLVLGLLMVSRVPIGKFRMTSNKIVNAATLANVVPVYACIILRVFPEYLLALSSTYIFVGGLVHTLRGVRPPTFAAVPGGVEVAVGSMVDDEAAADS